MKDRTKKTACVLAVVSLQGLQLVFGGVAEGILESSLAPGWCSVQVENPVSLSDFHSTLDTGANGGGYMPLAGAGGLSDSTNGISAEVFELARSLFHDPELIYEFVHNQIGYTPYWGLMKGARRTLLDKAGNDADQAMLLVDLLRASGYPTGYVTGDATYPLSHPSGYDLVSWLDCDGKGGSAVYDTLLQAIIPFDEGETDYTVARFWVRAEIDGMPVDFDPAFKHYENSGTADLLGMAGYSLQALLDAAGGTANADYAVGLSSANISAYLSNASQTLQTTIKGQHPNIDIAELAGGRTILPDQVNPAVMPQYNYVEFDAWDEIPTNYDHVVRFQLDDISYSCTMADMAERRVAIRYEDTGNGQSNLVGATEGYVSLPVSSEVLDAPALLSTYPDINIISYDYDPVGPPLPYVPNGGTDVDNYFGKVSPYGGEISGFLELNGFTYSWFGSTRHTFAGDFSGLNIMAGVRAFTVLYDIGEKFTQPNGSYVWYPNSIHTAIDNTETLEFRFSPTSFAGSGSHEALFHIDVHEDVPGGSTYYGYHEYHLTGDIAKKFNISGSAGAQIRAYPGSTATGYCVLSNNGDENFFVTGLSIVGQDANKFTPVNFSSGYVTPGQVVGFQIDYAADSATTRHAELKMDFTYDDIQYSLNFPVEGATIPETKAQIWLDGELVLEDGTARQASADNLLLSVEHPYGGALSNQPPSAYHLKRSGLYVAFSGYGDSMNGAVLEDSQRKLADYRDNGSLPSWMVQAETLQLIGHQWMQETMLANDLNRRLAGLNHCWHHRVGVAAQELGYYVDIKDQMVTISPLGAISKESAWKAGAMIQSAMEHGVLEQNQGSDFPAVSTIKILNESAMEGQKLFHVSSNNFSTVSAELVNYSTEDLAAIEGQVNAGMEYLLPQDAQYQLYDWSGYGFIALQDEWMGLVIGGDYPHFGGYSGLMGDASSYLLEDYIATYNKPPADVLHYYSDEPVDMTTGAYIFDKVDLSLDGPLGLAFSRHYNSLQDDTTRSMGNGWVHGYDIHAETVSAYEPALGRRSPEDAASAMLAGMVVDDLIRNEDNPKGWQTASFVAQWVVDQLTENAVVVHLGIKTLTFVGQPDGSYSSPPGTTWTLTGSEGSFVMQERNGRTYAFNANNQIQTIADPDGNTLSFTYTGGTNLHQVTSSFGPQFTFDYTGNLLASVSDNSGRSVSYQYDSNNNLTNFVDAAGKGWGIAYDDASHPHAITSLTDPEDITTIQNFYNSVGQVTNQISATGNPWNFYFTGMRNVEEDASGRQTAYCIDEKQRTWSIEKADETRTRSFFDGQNHIVNTVDEAGVTNVFVYDIDHNLLAQTNAWGTSDEVVACYGHDAEHHLRFATNAVGTAEQTVTEYTYTATHHVDTITEAKSTAVERTTDLDYFSNGLLEKKTEGNGKRVTDYTYDGNGNPDTIASTDAGTIDYLYNIRGDMKSMTVDEKTTAFGYDARRLPTAITNALGSADQVVVTKTYYDNGLLKTAMDGRGSAMHHYWTPAYKQAGTIFPDTGSTTNLYDNADRLVYSRDAEGNWTTNTLDAVGRSVYVASAHSTLTNQFNAVGSITNSIVDPSGLNLWTATEYDALNRPLVIQNSLFDVRYLYDSLGRATNRTDAASKNWKTEFDELGRVKKSYRPSNNYEEYGYDDLGNRTHFWNAEYKPMTFGVDGQGRVTSITNAVGKVTAFVYDDAGNLLQRTAADLTVTEYGYDDLNRLVAITNESVEVVTFDHDANGNLVGQTSLSAQSSFGYDEMNRLVASTQAVASAISIVGYQYDLNGSRIRVAYPGGTNAVYVYGADNRLESVDLSAFGIASDISFNYDSANRLTNIVYPNGIGSEFGYDANGNITSIKHGTSVDRTIQRNVLGFKQTELIDAGLKPTAPDNKRLIKTHNAADQLVSEQVQTDVTNWMDVAHSYSDNGCLASSVSSAKSMDYTYDYDNRLVGVDDASSIVEYIYDALGARVGRISGATTNYFVVDYADGLKRPLAETDPSGAITRYYVWSGMKLLCHIETSGEVYFYHSDELGSTLALTDSSGTVTDQFAYMPYGYANHSGTTETPFQWLGGYGVYYDVDTDLHLTLHRAYSCSLKRFLHPDPMGIDGGANVYAMANLNPLAFVDPFGLEANSAGSSAGLLDQFLGWADSTSWKIQSWADDNRAQTVQNYAQYESSYFDYMTNPEYATVRDYSQATRSVVDKVSTAFGVYGAYKAVTMPTQTQIGYHATKPQYAPSIRETGFRTGSSPGRLGSGGVYVNNSRAGAIAEFSYHNPGVTPEVLKVRYQPGVNAVTDFAPRGYVNSLPLNVDSITAPSVRFPSSQNTIIFNPNTIKVLP